MRFEMLALVAIVLGLASVAAVEDVILPPIQSDSSLPERLLIMIPGGLVSNQYYKLTGQAIQNASKGVRLTVVIPHVFQNLCIIPCRLSPRCSLLKQRIDDAVAKSGFKSKDPKEDTFIAGHSVGGACAQLLVEGYNYDFAGVLMFGIYLTGNASIANFSIPVLHMAGEVDGGGARPSTMAGFYDQTKSYAQTHGWEAALKLKPLHVLEGLDHSDFCPGFFVTATKDCKSEVPQEEALAKIGSVAGAFLHLNTPSSDETKSNAMAIMKQMLPFTQEICEPYLTAYQLEKDRVVAPQNGVPAGPWCEVAQRQIVGLIGGDSNKLKVEPCSLITEGLHAFEHQHTNYTVLPDGRLDVTCFSAVEAPSSSWDKSLFAAKSIDCKMVDATRVAEQLQVKTNTTVQCADINRAAVEVAKRLLPKKSRQRYEEKGRGICFMDDTHVVGNVGPLWVESALKRKETKDCLQVTSSKLVSTITSPIFPGNHYCKLLSPAAAMDWMMTDSHKPFPYHASVQEAVLI